MFHLPCQRRDFKVWFQLGLTLGVFNTEIQMHLQSLACGANIAYWFLKLGLILSPTTLEIDRLLMRIRRVFNRRFLIWKNMCISLTCVLRMSSREWYTACTVLLKEGSACGLVLLWSCRLDQIGLCVQAELPYSRACWRILKWSCEFYRCGFSFVTPSKGRCMKGFGNVFDTFFKDNWKRYCRS
jgi:hypothetical protein